MTIEEIDKKYNRCPFCYWYNKQMTSVCGDCKYLTPYPKPTDFDNFRGTDKWEKLLRRELK